MDIYGRHDWSQRGYPDPRQLHSDAVLEKERLAREARERQDDAWAARSPKTPSDLRNDRYQALREQTQKVQPSQMALGRGQWWSADVPEPKAVQRATPAYLPSEMWLRQQEAQRQSQVSRAQPNQAQPEIRTAPPAPPQTTSNGLASRLDAQRQQAQQRVQQQPTQAARLAPAAQQHQAWHTKASNDWLSRGAKATASTDGSLDVQLANGDQLTDRGNRITAPAGTKDPVAAAYSAGQALRERGNSSITVNLDNFRPPLTQQQRDQIYTDATALGFKSIRGCRESEAARQQGHMLRMDQQVERTNERKAAQIQSRTQAPSSSQRAEASAWAKQAQQRQQHSQDQVAHQQHQRQDQTRH